MEQTFHLVPPLVRELLDIMPVTPEFAFSYSRPIPLPAIKQSGQEDLAPLPSGFGSLDLEGQVSLECDGKLKAKPGTNPQDAKDQIYKLYRELYLTYASESRSDENLLAYARKQTDRVPILASLRSHVVVGMPYLTWKVPPTATHQAVQRALIKLCAKRTQDIRKKFDLTYYASDLNHFEKEASKQLEPQQLTLSGRELVMHAYEPYESWAQKIREMDRAYKFAEQHDAGHEFLWHGTASTWPATLCCVPQVVLLKEHGSDSATARVRAINIDGSSGNNPRELPLSVTRTTTEDDEWDFFWSETDGFRKEGDFFENNE